MPTVFIINQPQAKRARPGEPEPFTYDVSPAMKYGDVEFIFRADQNFPSSDPAGAVKHAQTVLSNFTENDFLVWAGGDPLGMVIAAAVIGDFSASIKYLKWERARDENGDRKGGGYYTPVVLNIWEN